MKLLKTKIVIGKKAKEAGLTKTRLAQLVKCAKKEEVKSFRCQKKAKQLQAVIQRMKENKEAPEIIGENLSDLKYLEEDARMYMKDYQDFIRIIRMVAIGQFRRAANRLRDVGMRPWVSGQLGGILKEGLLRFHYKWSADNEISR